MHNKYFPIGQGQKEIKNEKEKTKRGNGKWHMVEKRDEGWTRPTNTIFYNNVCRLLKPPTCILTQP